MKYKVGDKVVLTDDVDKLISLYINEEDARVMAGHEYTITHIDDIPIQIDTMTDVGPVYYINEECVSVENTMIDHIGKAFLFSYWINSAIHYCYEANQIVILAASQKEANKKFYTRVAEKDFKEIKVVCEEVEILS